MSAIEVGDVCRAVASQGDAPAALVLITHLDRQTRSATVALLSPDIEFGSSSDILLPGESIGRPYDLLIEPDIFGYVWTSQLDRHIGKTAVPQNGNWRGLYSVAGPPVAGRHDPRWDYQLGELSRLQRLTAECTGALLDMQVPEPVT